jgi:hypothetical protein
MNDEETEREREREREGEEGAKRTRGKSLPADE